MLAIVNQSVNLTPPITPTLTQQFNKLRNKRLFTDNLFVFLVQYIGLKLSVFSLSPSPLWLATGSACTYLFLRGYGVLPGVWLGSLFGFYFEGIGLNLALKCASVLSLQGLLLIWFSHRYLSPTLIFNSQRRFLQFIIYTALLTAAISLTFMEICYSVLPHTKPPLQYAVQWWLANFNAIMIFSCALLTWDAYFPDVYTIKQWKNIITLFSILLLLIIALIFSHTPVSTTCFALSIILITAFISARWGWCGAIAAVFLSGMLLCFAGFLDAPIFSTYSATVSLLLVQLFLCVNTIVALSLSF